MIQHNSFSRTIMFRYHVMVSVILVLLLWHGCLLKNMYPRRFSHGQMRYSLYLLLLRLILIVLIVHFSWCGTQVELFNENYWISGLFISTIGGCYTSKFDSCSNWSEPCSKLERDLLSLPCRLGGLNIPILTQISGCQFSASKQISAPLASLIIQQSREFSISSLQSIKCDICQTKQQLLVTQFNNIKSGSDPLLQHTIEMLSAKYSLLWLTAPPFQE